MPRVRTKRSRRASFSRCSDRPAAHRPFAFLQPRRAPYVRVGQRRRSRRDVRRNSCPTRVTFPPIVATLQRLIAPWSRCIKVDQARAQTAARTACACAARAQAIEAATWTEFSSAAATAFRAACPISGAKNAALTLMPCALLTDEPLTLRNLPRLADVDSFGHLLNQLGASTTIEGSRPEDFGRVMTIRAGELTSTDRALRHRPQDARVDPRARAAAWRARARRRCRCPAAARSATARSTCI